MSARASMFARLAVIAWLGAACDGGGGARADAGAGAHDAARDAGAGCTAQLSGNFTEAASAAACATVAVDGSGDAILDLAIPSTTLAPAVPAAFELGPSPAAGPYSSESVATWSARGVRTVGTGACVYNAGAAAVPPGDFTLALGSIDDAAGTAHGTLALTLWVLAYPGTDCGAGDTEQVDVEF